MSGTWKDDSGVADALDDMAGPRLRSQTYLTSPLPTKAEHILPPPSGSGAGSAAWYDQLLSGPTSQNHDYEKGGPGYHAGESNGNAFDASYPPVSQRDPGTARGPIDSACYGEQEHDDTTVLRRPHHAGSAETAASKSSPSGASENFSDYIIELPPPSTVRVIEKSGSSSPAQQTSLPSIESRFAGDEADNVMRQQGYQYQFPDARGGAMVDQQVGMPLSSSPNVITHMTSQQDMSVLAFSAMLQSAYSADSSPNYITLNPSPPQGTGTFDTSSPNYVRIMPSESSMFSQGSGDNTIQRILQLTQMQSFSSSGENRSTNPGPTVPSSPPDSLNSFPDLPSTGFAQRFAADSNTGSGTGSGSRFSSDSRHRAVGSEISAGDLMSILEGHESFPSLGDFSRPMAFQQYPSSSFEIANYSSSGSGSGSGSGPGEPRLPPQLVTPRSPGLDVENGPSRARGPRPVSDITDARYSVGTAYPYPYARTSRHSHLKPLPLKGSWSNNDLISTTATDAMSSTPKLQTGLPFTMYAAAASHRHYNSASSKAASKRSSSAQSEQIPHWVAAFYSSSDADIPHPTDLSQGGHTRENSRQQQQEQQQEQEQVLTSDDTRHDPDNDGVNLLRVKDDPTYPANTIRSVSSSSGQWQDPSHPSLHHTNTTDYPPSIIFPTPVVAPTPAHTHSSRSRTHSHTASTGPGPGPSNPVHWSPRLTRDRDAKRTSILLSPPAPVYPRATTAVARREPLLSRRRVQVWAFALGFICPVFWFVAAVLPLPVPVDGEAEKGEGEGEGGVAAMWGARSSWYVQEDPRWLNARWWRKANRIMCPVGVAVVVIVVVLGVLAGA